MLTSLATALDERPDGPATGRLHPPAYPDDPELDAGYQLLAGEELRSSRREAIDAVLRSVGRTQLTEGEAWAWLRALNSLRLVLGTQLGIETDDDVPRLSQRDDPVDAALWDLYEFATVIQGEITVALGD